MAVAPLGERPAILHMREVDKTFNGGVVALRRMNLDVNEGDFISLLGPSAGGKSTALRLIAGLMLSPRWPHRVGGRIVLRRPWRRLPRAR